MERGQGVRLSQSPWHLRKPPFRLGGIGFGHVPLDEDKGLLDQGMEDRNGGKRLGAKCLFEPRRYVYWCNRHPGAVGIQPLEFELWVEAVYLSG